MNEFNGLNLSIKDKLQEIWYKYKLYIIISACVIIGLIIILTIINSGNKIDTNDLTYRSVETIMKNNAKEYVKSNSINSNLYLSLNELNLKIDKELKCESTSGVLKEQNNYYPYLVCDKYQSDSIENIINKNINNKGYGNLKGDNPYILTSGEYVEPGYDVDSKYMVNVKNSDIENGVNIISYYILENNNYVAELKRIVIADDVKGNTPTIELVGNRTISVPQNSEFKEPGYTANDKTDGDITEKVKVDGNVDTSVPGNYQLSYSVTNSKNKKGMATRTVIVNKTQVTLAISHTINPLEVTGEGVTITLDINGNDYEKTILPNNTESTSKNPTYVVYKNDNYEFIIYDKNGNSEVYEVKITNADNTPPVLTCKGIIDNGKTTITITPNEKISYYTYGDSKEKENSNTKIYNSLETKIIVNGYDTADNKGSVVCQTGKNIYYTEMARPYTGEIVQEATSDTLKVTIYKTDYGYLSYVWALDPYNQFNKATNDWGVKNMPVADIMNREITNKGLGSKIVIAINGSGFYKKDAYVPKCLDGSYLAKYYNTTEGPLVITDGKVVRNWYYDKAIDRSRNHSIYGINPDGKLMAYPRINSYTESERQNLFQTIIDSGIRNTFVFRPTIMVDGEFTQDYIKDIFIVDGSNRQMLCQVNTNNFMFLSAFRLPKKRIRDEMFKTLGCQTVINFDGGGSVGLVFKGKNGSLITVHGGRREIVDAAYFVEK